MRELLIAAAREFNAGRYFEAHEVLEDGLDCVPEDLWDLFVGLIQIAVGYHKATQQLWDGSVAMLARGLAKAEPFPTGACGIDLDALRRRVRFDIAALRAGTFDPGAMNRQPPRLRPTV